jgi:hypothetical protein
MNTYPTLEEVNMSYELNLSQDVVERHDNEYNCMGFAIGTYEWESLEDFEYTDDLEDEDEDAVSLRSSICYECALKLTLLSLYIENYPRMRVLESRYEKLEDDEYLIAMKVSEDDYHFCRQMDDGRWYEKCGSGPIRECTNTAYDEEWWSLCGQFHYDSNTVYLAVTK